MLSTHALIPIISNPRKVQQLIQVSLQCFIVDFLMQHKFPNINLIRRRSQHCVVYPLCTHSKGEGVGAHNRNGYSPIQELHAYIQCDSRATWPHIHDDNLIGWYAASRGTPTPANLDKLPCNRRLCPKITKIQQNWQFPPTSLVWQNDNTL